MLMKRVTAGARARGFSLIEVMVAVIVINTENINAAPETKASVVIWSSSAARSGAPTDIDTVQHRCRDPGLASLGPEPEQPRQSSGFRGAMV